jgi:hypothetical protein
MNRATSPTLTALHPRTPVALQFPKGSGLATALEILTVAACLALGAGFLGSLWPAAPSAVPAAEAARSCPAGTAAC